MYVSACTETMTFWPQNVFRSFLSQDALLTKVRENVSTHTIDIAEPTRQTDGQILKQRRTDGRHKNITYSFASLSDDGCTKTKKQTAGLPLARRNIAIQLVSVETHRFQLHNATYSSVKVGYTESVYWLRDASFIVMPTACQLRQQADD